MKSVYLAATLLVAGLTLPACQSSSEKGVTSNYHSQWTDVNADVKTTTSAAEMVLRDNDLKDVKSSATNVDGSASAKKADGTKVNASITRKSDTKSSVSVTIGTMGDPALGAEMAKKIKDRAEMGGTNMTSTTRP